VRAYNGTNSRPTNVRVYRVYPCIFAIKSVNFPERTFLVKRARGGGEGLQLQTKRGKVVWLGEWNG